MKAIEVRSKDKVLYNGSVHEVVKTMLNSVVIKCSKGYKTNVSYSQIEKYEPTQIEQQKQKD